ncbi:MAG TPA: cell division protein FtsZ [Candidatus Limnocylindrales bacterium]|nr:cell division protein FtsZ [Candidatus Limnocylindrales bacterium]
MDPDAQTFVQLVLLVLLGLLFARIVTSIPGWLRRDRRPEARSILVVGVGGGGGNAVDRMVDVGLPEVGFVAVNTDAQALRESRAELRVRIGDRVTRGLGSGGDPEIGRRAAEEDAARIAAAVAGADLVFVTAGLGGGTGSGAAPTVAAKAREGGALTIAVVTKPFDFEGTPRRDVADDAAEALLAEVDAMITVPNDHVGQVIDPDASALEAFRVVDEVLLKAVEGVVDLLTAPGLINLDFADIRSVVQGAGPALIGLGEGRGEDRAVIAARQAASSPLLESSIEGARGVLLQISGPADLSLREVRQAADVIRGVADPRANVIFGASIGAVPDDQVYVTLIATGLDAQRRPALFPRPTPLVRAAPPPSPAAAAPEAATPATTSAAPTQLQFDPDEPLELPTFLRNPRPTSGTGRRREPRKTPTPTGSRRG